MLYWVRAFAGLTALVFTLGFGQLALAQDPPAPVQVYDAASRVGDAIDRMDAAAAEVRAHRFAPAYYEEPCTPTKADGEKSLAPYRVQRRTFMAEVAFLKSQIQELEKFSTNKLQLAEKGWDWQNLNRFRKLENALANYNGAIADAEARLDAMPTLPCRQTPPPKPVVDDGPTAADADLLKDDTLPPPRFDDPIPPLSLPASFCSYEERNRYLKEVYWPWAERFKQNALKAVDHMTALENRRNRIAYAEGPDSPRARAADRYVKAWEAIKKQRMADHEAALKVHDAVSSIPVIDCNPPGEPPKEPPTATGGGVTPPTGVVGGGTAVTPPTPTPPKPTTPLPPGVVRPTLVTVPPLSLPTKFCSESARNAYLVDVYHPAAAAASRNAVLAAGYAAQLSNLAYDANAAGDGGLRDALNAERQAWDATLKAAEAEAKRYIDMRAQILAIPVVACADDAQPVTDPKPRLPPPDLTRPALQPVGRLEPPASFCDEFARVAYMNTVYTPAAKASLANAQAATAHLGKLGGMFTDYMKNEGGPGWAAVRQEQTAYGPIAEAASAESVAINALYQRILAIPIVPCGETRVATGDPTTPPPTPVADGAAVLPRPPADGKKPCPPKQGRKPIVVGPNGKVGSGAKLAKDLGKQAIGMLGGALGLGGGGGGGGEPQLYKCRIKDSEMTVFDDPATGVSLKVGAKRGKGDTVNIFATIAKSPDQGTFQTAFLEKPPNDLQGGQTQAPFDVGPCDLWGEWKLTVSWTKDTYVDGQLVDHQEGGWSEGGKFAIPGMLSKADAPTGMWKQMGFSSASHGARQAFMAFKVPPGGGPLTFVVHVTRPKGDPVTTVPFVMTMTETAPGVFGFSALKTEEDCPPVPADRVMIADGTDAPRLAVASNPGRAQEPPLPPPDTRTTPPIPPPLGDPAGPATAERPKEPPLPPPDTRTTPPIPPPLGDPGQPVTQERPKEAPLPPPDTRTTPPTPPPQGPPKTYEPTTRAGGERWSPAMPEKYRSLKGSKVRDLRRLQDLFELLHKGDGDRAADLEKAANTCQAGGYVDPELSWWSQRDRWRDSLMLTLGLIDTAIVEGPQAEEIRALLDAERISVKEMLDTVDALKEPRCAPPSLPPSVDAPPESILDSIEEVFVPA